MRRHRTPCASDTIGDMRLPRLTPVMLSRILLATGVIFLTIWGTHTALRLRSLQLSHTILSAFSNTTSYKTRVTRIQVANRIDIPVVESGYVNGAWIISPNRANHVFQSATPGTPGNIIIYAHNKFSLFGPLLWTSIGEGITLTTSNGTTRRYAVKTIAEVDPGETALLLPTTTEVLTLYTCSGFLDSKRFVVRAVPETK